MNEITIVIITYKSRGIIYDFIKKIPSTMKIMIIDNSQDHELKKDIEEFLRHIRILLLQYYRN